ncbi:hypothetical protein [Plesiocystis pacifica]|uniref:hypothetical protein n=1 Tax=Plesiocystis pacifica TaxID=191768 RepID=UPI0012FB2D1F|nr:hypothetical protein [Plesiocystis pacifica]
MSARTSGVLLSFALVCACTSDDVADGVGDEATDSDATAGTTDSTGTDSSTDGTGETEDADSTSTDADTETTDTDADMGETEGETGGGDELYEPDDGPSHEGGNVVEVCSEAEILAAIAAATSGDVITVCPGSFDFNQLISVTANGTDSGRIFLRAEAPETVTFNLSHIENFKVSGKFWIFENITFFGDCDNASACEHAFHLVGDADDLIFRHNEVVNFASHVKLNGEVVGGGPAKSFPDRVWFIDNFWHNTKYVENDAPHNILNLDGGKDHVVRGNIFADYSAPTSLPKSASAVYPKASTVGMLIEQNLIVCEKSRPEGETNRGIQLGDGAPASICDGDDDQDGNGDCIENGQNQEALVRNNIIMGCNNGGSSGGIMINSDRESWVAHNTVYDSEPRSAVFYQGHPDYTTPHRYNILENGFNTDYADGVLDEADNFTPAKSELDAAFGSPGTGDFSLADGAAIVEQHAADLAVPHDFCGYPRGEMADLGAIEYSTTYEGTPCSEIVQEMYDRIP